MSGQKKISNMTWAPDNAVMHSFWQSATSCCPIVVVGVTTIVMEPGKKVEFWHVMEFVPAGNKCPSNSMGIVFPYPVGRATMIWSLSCASNAGFKMSTWECSVTVIENLRISPGSHGARARRETAFSNPPSVLLWHAHPLFLLLRISHVSVHRIFLRSLPCSLVVTSIGGAASLSSYPINCCSWLDLERHLPFLQCNF